jgi:hypothetical protein
MVIVTVSSCSLMAMRVAIGRVAWALENQVQSDFTAYWRGAISVAAGQSPYSWLNESRATEFVDYVYTPLLALLLAPFTSVLDYAGARWAWLALNILCLAAGGLLTWRASGLHRHWRDAIVWLPFLAVLPWSALALLQGQASPPLFLLVSAVFALLHARRPSPAGALVAVAAAIKSFPGLLGCYLLLRGQWRASLVALVTGLVIAVGIVSMLGWEAIETYLTHVIPALRSMYAGSYNISLTGFFTRLLIPNASTTPAAPAPEFGQALILASTLGMFAATAYGVWRAPRDSSGEGPAYALAVVAMLVVSPISGLYNLVVALLPFAVATARIGPSEIGRRLCLLTAMMLVFLPLHFVVPFPPSGWNVVLACAPLFGLLLLWAQLLQLCLIPAHSAPRLAGRSPASAHRVDN